MPRKEESKILKGLSYTAYWEGNKPIRRHRAPSVFVRKFNGKRFESRPHVDLHRYKRDAIKAAQNQRKRSFLVRVIKDKIFVPDKGMFGKWINGWRIWRRKGRK